MHASGVNSAWVFSLLWCGGVSSVGSEAAGLFSTLEKPLYSVDLTTYLSPFKGVARGTSSDVSFPGRD